MPDPAVMHGVLRHLRRSERRRLYHLLGDRELLSRFLADRDEAAFEEVVVRHGPMVRAICRRVLGPTADADDAFQAAFLVLIRRARSIRNSQLLAGWLCAVAYKTARQALRRRSRRSERERHVDELPEPSRLDDPPKDWLPLFDDALQRLPAKYREPVVLCELQGLSRRDASARLGLSEGTLSSRLGRARDLLRRKLDRYGFPLAIGAALSPAVVPEALTASTAAAALHVSAASVTAVTLSEGVLTAMLVTKLKAGALAGTAVLVAGLAAGLHFAGPANGAAGPGKDGPPAKDSPKPVAAAKADPRPPTPAAALEPFQGKWEVTSAEWDGAATNPRNIGIDENWTFTGNKLTTGGDVKADVTEEFTIDVKAKPVAIDFTLTQFTADGTGKMARTAYQGICRFEPDGALKLCFRKKGDSILRPTRFATAHNSGATVLTLRRPETHADVVRPVPASVDYALPVENKQPDQIPPPLTKEPAKDADLGKVVGAWELVDVDGQEPNAAAAKLNAKPNPAGGTRSLQRWEHLRRLTLLPAAGPMDLTNQPGASSYVAYVDLDGRRSPKWFTLHATETVPAAGGSGASAHPVRLSGIYHLDGEKLVICLPEEQGSPLLRPTDFKGDGEGGLYLLTFQRASKTWKGEKVAPQPSEPKDLPSERKEPLPAPAAPGIPDLGRPFTGPSGPVPTDVSGGVVPSAVPPSPPPVSPVAPAGVPVIPSSPLPPPAVHVPPADVAIPPPAVSTDRRPDSGVPPAPAAAVPLPDLDRLQGVWIVAQANGQSLKPEEQLKETFEFLKDHVLVGDEHGRVRLDEAKVPRQIHIDINKEGEKPIVGIYKLEGDRLVIAASTKWPKLIPTTFEPDPDAGIEVMVLERSKVPPPPAPSTPKDAAKPARDLQKEIDQLRDQLQRLEKELKGPKD